MKPLKIFEVLAKRRMTFWAVLCILVLITSSSFGWIYYSKSKRAKAVQSYNRLVMSNDNIGGHVNIIKQDDKTYDNSDTQLWDIVIPSGVTAIIDGVHNFRNLTVQNGGTLTGSDYNNYGTYNAGNLYDKRYENLIGSSDAEYTFIMRGVINMGANPGTWIFSPCSGNPDEWNYTNPATMKIDDVASVEFFTPVTKSDTDKFVYDPALWAGSAVGHATASLHTNATHFVDDKTDTDHTLLPFEYRYENTSGPANFGLCYASAGPDDILNNHYISTIGIENLFSDTTLTPEMQTYTAWQGASQNKFSGHINDYTEFTTYINSFKSGDGFNPNYFYQANNYDFKNDKKIILVNDVGMLNDSRFFEARTEQDDYDNYRRHVPATTNNLSTFWPTTGWYSPLASRVVGANGYIMKNFQPYLSNSLVYTLPVKVLTKLNILETFTVEGGGKVNYNGTGFAYSKQRLSTGPAGATLSGAGASHSGAGGDSSTNNHAKTVYDANAAVPPALPGSGSLGWWSYPGVDWLHYECSNQYEYDHGNGGGYLNIKANKIDLQTDSMVMANAVGGNAGSPPAGASGGAIILADADKTSNYKGLITAQGGAVSANADDKTGMGSGGGGYVYITTAISDTSTLVGLEDKTALAPTTGHRFGISDVKNPTWDFWDNPIWDTGIKARNAVSVAPGHRESGGRGNWGLFNVNRATPPLLKIEKTVTKGGVPVYSFKPGDVLEIKLHVTNLTVGQSTTISDNFFSDGTGGRVFLVENTSAWTPAGFTITAGSSVNWTFTPANTAKDFTYILKVQP